MTTSAAAMKVKSTKVANKAGNGVKVYPEMAKQKDATTPFVKIFISLTDAIEGVSKVQGYAFIGVTICTFCIVGLGALPW